MDKSYSYNLFGAQSGFLMTDAFTPRKHPEQPSSSSSAYSAHWPSSFSLFSGAVRPSSSGWETFREDVVSTRRQEFTSPPRPMQLGVQCMSPENQVFPTTQLYTSTPKKIEPETAYMSSENQAFSQTQFFSSPPPLTQTERSTTGQNHVFLPTRWSPELQSAPSRAASHLSNQRADMASQPIRRHFTRAQGFSGPPTVCVFCKTNGERLSQYGSHVLKDQSGRVTCPILRRYTCPICGASGDTAHTLKYCPLNKVGF